MMNTNRSTDTLSRKDGDIVRYIVCALLLLAVAAGSAFAQDQKPAEPVAAPVKAATPAMAAEVEVCTGITERMPTGSATSFGADVGSLYCWCKITGARGETAIKHVWLRDGKEMATVELSAKGDPWRTFSQKRILPQWTGNWEVKVVDAAGTTLKSVSFTVGAPSN